LNDGRGSICHSLVAHFCLNKQEHGLMSACIVPERVPLALHAIRQRAGLSHKNSWGGKWAANGAEGNWCRDQRTEWISERGLCIYICIRAARREEIMKCIQRPPSHSQHTQIILRQKLKSYKARHSFTQLSVSGSVDEINRLGRRRRRGCFCCVVLLTSIAKQSKMTQCHLKYLTATSLSSASRISGTYIKKKNQHQKLNTAFVTCLHEVRSVNICM
jgi:hypothetical protein